MSRWWSRDPARPLQPFRWREEEPPTIRRPLTLGIYEVIIDGLTHTLQMDDRDAEQARERGWNVQRVGTVEVLVPDTEAAPEVE